MTETILFKDESYAIQGAIFEVYREMGCVPLLFPSVKQRIVSGFEKGRWCTSGQQSRFN